MHHFISLLPLAACLPLATCPPAFHTHPPRKEEFRKTTAKQLRVLMWVDGSKKEPLCHDAAKLAAAHVVRSPVCS